MAASAIFEEESGTYVGPPCNPHQGYYAGDFSRSPGQLDGFARAVKYSEWAKAHQYNWSAVL